MEYRTAFIRLLQAALICILLLCCGCKVPVHKTDADAFNFKEASTAVSPRHITGEYSLWGSNKPAQLSEDQLNIAKQAWTYFTRTVFPETGLPQGAVGSDTLTMDNVASYLAALTSANWIGLLEEVEFHARMTKIVTWLNTMQLNSLGVPNTFYNARTGQSINGAGQPGEDGHSALELGRLLIWMRIVRNIYPTHAAAIDRAVLRWNFRNLIDADGLLYGSYYREGKLRAYRQGRLGHLQYAAKGFALWGFNIAASLKADSYSLMTINKILLPFDNRPVQERNSPRPFGEPFQIGAVSTTFPLLDGIEFNWKKPGPAADFDRWPQDLKSEQFAASIYEVQKSRYTVDGILTARADHNLDRPPYFVIDSVLALGEPFATIDKSGRPQIEQACVSTGASFLLWAMFDQDYTDMLMDSVVTMYDSYGGWYAGFYESSGTINKAISLNDNAVILESLAFMLSGPLFQPSVTKGYWELTLENESFEEKGLPPARFQNEFQPMLNMEKTEPQP
ncbi:DUF3131 domain-containing protein [Maridesulfovibrio zosterae]|uniref:DUF3131 domain-containing protein n=1 Tax=Maridesulfovibrio zosterae TaxID=82171 RepID=UPI0004022F88|nr:DUF3131 domain-containing protein [Maridesulfovibrio zosterae]